MDEIMQSKAPAAVSQHSRPKFVSCDAHLRVSEQPVIHQSSWQPASDVGGWGRRGLGNMLKWISSL